MCKRNYIEILFILILYFYHGLRKQFKLIISGQSMMSF
jgi:hypothetical protein